MTAIVIQGDARRLPLPDESVDLVVTSPPYFGLRSYQDDGEHYAGQIGSEASPAQFLDELWACTAEWIRVLKPSGSIFVNLGDKYSDRANPQWRGSSDLVVGRQAKGRRPSSTDMAPRKSLLGLPWRYAIGCIDELGLLLREEVIWSKPNALPESVRDRCRRTHEQWFHFTRKPSYFAAMDEIREPHTGGSHAGRKDGRPPPDGLLEKMVAAGDRGGVHKATNTQLFDPRGRLPGSVWSIASEQLRLPESLGVEHFAAFPSEWPRRLIMGWSPVGICDECGDALMPTIDVEQIADGKTNSGRAKRQRNDQLGHDRGFNAAGYPHTTRSTRITGYSCSCGTPVSTRPAVVLDPFGGTGTTALMADVLGRTGISVDLSYDYCRLGAWRTTDGDERARAMRVDKPPVQLSGQGDLFDMMASQVETA